MKKIGKYMIVALAGLSMLACTKEVELNPEEGSEVYSYTIAIDEGTKMFLDGDHMAWQEYDYIDWFAISGSYGYESNGSSVINMNTDPRTFSVSSPISIDAGGYIYACAPSAWGTKDEAHLSIPTDQNDDDGAIHNAMPMVSLPISVTDRIKANTNTPVAETMFINLGAVIEYNIFDSSDNDEYLQGVTFEATTPIAGEFTVNLTTVAEDNIPSISGLTEKAVNTIPYQSEIVGNSKANGLKVYQVVAPGTHSGTITVITNDAIYTYSVSGITFNRSSVKRLNVDLSSANATRRSFADIEAELAGREWVLSSVTIDGSDATYSAEDSMTLNADFSITYDCSANPGNVYDYSNDQWLPYDFGPSTATREWYVSTDGKDLFLAFRDYGYPLIVDEWPDSERDYKIVSMTNTTLVLNHWGSTNTGTSEFVITFTDANSSPAPANDPETILKSYNWELISVEQNGADVTQTAGNKIKFNADYSYTIDCSANNGNVYDYYHVGTFPGQTDYDYYISNGFTLAWSITTDATNDYLRFTRGAFPLVVVADYDNYPIDYTIVTLDNSNLVLQYGEYTMCYKSDAVDPNDPATLLTAPHAWTLASVEESGTDVTNTQFNKITFNADHSYSVDYSVNGDVVYDYYYNSVRDRQNDYDFFINNGETLEWSITNNGTSNFLDFTRCAHPLVILGDYANNPMSYEIVTLDNNTMVLQYGNYTMTYTAISDAVVSLETLLKAKTWELSTVYENDMDVTYTAGNKISFNDAYGYTIDCSANSDYCFNFTDGSYSHREYDYDNYIQYYPLAWSISTNGTNNYLTFTKYAHPVAIVGDYKNEAMTFEILTLSGSSLVIKYGDYTLSYTAAQ